MRKLLIAALFLAAPAWAVGIWTNGTQLVSGIIWKPGAHGFYATNFHDPQGCGGSEFALPVRPVAQ